MRHSPEQIEEAIRLSEDLAEKQRILDESKEAGRPADIISELQREVDLANIEVLTDPLAEGLLDQAMLNVALRQARLEVLQESCLGKLKDLLSNLSDQCIWGANKLNEGGKFDDEPNNLLWATFRTALEKGDKKGTLDALVDLIGAAEIGLTKVRLPKGPFRYYLPKRVR